MKFTKKIFANRARFIVLFSLLCIAAITTLYMVYMISLWHSIENELRFIGTVILTVFLAILFLWAVKVLLKGKILPFLFIVFVKIFYIVILLFFAFNINKIYTALGRVSSNTEIFSTSLVTIYSESDDIQNISKGKIAIYNNEDSIDGYQLPKEILEKRKITNEVVYIDSYFDIFEKLENREITYAFLPTNFSFMFEEVEELTPIIEKIRIIYTEEKEVASDRERKQLDINEPMTLLLMGVDSYTEDIKRSTFNGDALIVVTFNPKTMTTTMLSIPRDTYMPIACFPGQRKNKITHAAWYGEKCVQSSIENLLDIEIDYVVKMNFLGLVRLVDAVGGVEVDVPYSFCEQDSRRRWGNHTIYVMEGKQTLDGEQALALTRNRKNNTWRCGYGVNWTNDFVRGQHQQLVLKALLEEFRKIRNLTTIQEILDEIANTMETDLTTNEILSFYNVFRDVLMGKNVKSFEDVVRVKRLYLSGYDMSIHDYSQITNQGMRANLYNFVPYQGSLNDVIAAMKINLGLLEKEEIVLFSFNVNEPYEEMIIGKKHYNEARMIVLPDFSNQTKEQIQAFANNNSLNYEFIVVPNQGQYNSNQIISQRPRPRTDIDYVTKITIEIADKYEAVPQPSYIDCSQEAGLEKCQFPNLIDKTYAEYLKIKKLYNLNWAEIVTDKNHELYDPEKSLLIIDQNVTPGTDIYELYEQEILITYMAKHEEIEEDEPEEE